MLETTERLGVPEVSRSRVPRLMLFVVALALMVARSLGAQSPEQTVREFHSALSTGDTARVIELLARDVSIFESGRAELSREEYRSHHLGGDMAFSAAVTIEVVDSHSMTFGETALVLRRTRATGVFRDREIDSRGTETMVLRRTAEGWRIVHIHWSSRRGD